MKRSRFTQVLMKLLSSLSSAFFTLFHPSAPLYSYVPCEGSCHVCVGSRSASNSVRMCDLRHPQRLHAVGAVLSRFIPFFDLGIILIYAVASARWRRPCDGRHLAAEPACTSMQCIIKHQRAGRCLRRRWANCGLRSAAANMENLGLRRKTQEHHRHHHQHI